MMKKGKRIKRNASLLEIICMLGVLMLVSAFLVRLFVGADSLRRKARDISKACILSESIADTIKGYQTMDEAMESLKLVQIQDNYSTAIYEEYFDSKWNSRKKPDAYRIIVTVEQQKMDNNRFYDVNIVVKNEKNYPFIKNDVGNVLASLHVSSYK